STQFVVPQPAIDSSSLRITEVLVPAESGEDQEARLADGTAARCDRGVASEAVVLMTRDSQPAALRLLLDSGARLTLVADGRLFSNAAMRDTRAGEFSLGLVVGRTDKIVVDEYLHGFGPGGGMLATARDWLRNSPARWTLLQWCLL